jgi:hypothetical protein
MKEKLIVVFLMAITNVAFLKSIEKETDYSSMLIYGKVTTVSDQEYIGQIRWGNEEAFWFDFFNSQKPDNDNLKYLSKKEIKGLNEKDHHTNKDNWWGWGNNNKWNNDHEHIFACQFGDIKSLDIRGSEKVILKLKNGEEIKLVGGSNDIGAKIQVNDPEMGHVKLDWKRIAHVEFMSAPKGLESYYGDPLYGTVETRDGDFTGFVQWDHDERLGNDELNGDNRDGEIDIQFKHIASIKKEYGGSLVTLFSGREFELSGSNDVDDDNRGIIVNNPDYGRVDIDWDEFIKVDYISDAPMWDHSYKDYKGEEKLSGTVITKDGDTYRGKIIFDLDEVYKLEMLNGMHEEIEYFVPFSLVRSITPLNRSESKVELASGKEYILEDKVDVNESNDGVLIFKSENDYDYVSWQDIEQVRFDN